MASSCEVYNCVIYIFIVNYIAESIKSILKTYPGGKIMSFTSLSSLLGGPIQSGGITGYGLAPGPEEIPDN
jgi:hypothetical protein